MAYLLHVANKNYSSWSLRPWVLMRELGIAFEERVHVFGSGESFYEFSPSGKVPCLVDGELVVWDSLAIVEYLAEAHAGAGVWPADPRAPRGVPSEMARVWARCAAAEMHAGFDELRARCSMSCGVRVRLHEQSEGLRRDVARIDALWSEGLQKFGGPFLAGPQFGAVDAFFCPVAFRVQTYGLELSAAAHEYVERLLALPSMQQWYTDALAEPWRDAAHELELGHAGELLEDLRLAGKSE